MTSTGSAARPSRACYNSTRRRYCSWPTPASRLSPPSQLVHQPLCIYSRPLSRPVRLVLLPGFVPWDKSRCIFAAYRFNPVLRLVHATAGELEIQLKGKKFLVTTGDKRLYAGREHLVVISLYTVLISDFARPSQLSRLVGSGAAACAVKEATSCQSHDLDSAHTSLSSKSKRYRGLISSYDSTPTALPLVRSPLARRAVSLS